VKAYHKKDFFHQKAKKDGLRARSAYKLQEIDRRCQIFQRGMDVLDLGCAPGSWLEYAHSKVGKKAKLLGFDLENVNFAQKNISFAQEDILSLGRDNELLAAHKSFDVIMSDAMVNTSGIVDSDCANSIELCQKALDLAVQDDFLKSGGHLIVKIFEGPGFEEFNKNFKKFFKKNKRIIPEASRIKSRELYLIGLNKR